MAMPLAKPELQPLGQPERPSKEPEAIFRPVRGADGEVRIVKLPATLEILLHPRLEDQLTQSNDHLLVIFSLFDALKRYLKRLAPDLAVLSDLLLLYGRHGHRDVTPDIAVVEGLPEALVEAAQDPGAELDSLDVTAEGAHLVFVMEVVSTSTAAMRKKDEVSNPPLFAALGVKDHVLVYPPESGGPARLVAQKLWKPGQYVPNPPNVQGRIQLDSVGLWIWVDEESGLPMFEHRATGQRFLTSEQEEHRAEEQQRRAEEQQRRADDAERRVGEAEILGQAKTLLNLLDARGFSLDANSRDRILGCRDSDRIVRWTHRIFTLEKLEDLWK